jgi:hypothetical protein
MKIGIVGPTFEQRSLPFDAQRSINLYPVIDEMGKEVAAMYSVPGKELFATAGVGPIRGGFASTNDRVFFVSGSNLHEIFSGGTTSILGALDSSSGNLTFAENGTQMAICDGSKLYILTYATNVLTKVIDPDLPTNVGTVAYSDGYFLVSSVGTGRFYRSALNDGLSWNALDFRTAESSPDNLIRVITALGQIWLMGSFTTEIWTLTGDSNFPFRRISGAKLEVGILSPYSAVEIDNSIVWVGKDRFGQGVVYRAQGFTPIRISNTPIEKRIQEATNPDEIVAYAYQDEGNVFYVLTGGGLETSLVYDFTTQQWHERAFMNDAGVFETDLGMCHVYGFHKHLVGDRRNGSIYNLSQNVYTDGSSALVRERVYTHLSDEGQRIRYNALEIGIEAGVGLQTGQGSDPLISLALSRDGARTWIDCGTTSFGMVGQYLKKVEFRRLGIAEQMTFKIRISDPVKVAIVGSYLR